MKPTKEQIEDMIVMQSGLLKQDLMTAMEVVRDAGIDVTSPVAPVIVNYVLAEVRMIRNKIENPNPFAGFIGGMIQTGGDDVKE